LSSGHLASRVVHVVIVVVGVFGRVRGRGSGGARVRGSGGSGVRGRGSGGLGLVGRGWVGGAFEGGHVVEGRGIGMVFSWGKRAVVVTVVEHSGLVEDG
jgi:hypothetical protein